MPPEPFQIRPVAKEELGAVLAIDRICFGSSQGYNALMLRQIFDAAPESFLVAERRQSIIGYIAALPGTVRGDFWVVSLAVHPDQRRGGVALALCRTISEALRQGGAERVLLTVRPDNAPVVKISGMLGFKTIGEEADYFGPGQRRLLLAWERGQQ